MAKRRKALPTPLANSTTLSSSTTQPSRRRTELPRDPSAGSGYPAAGSGTPLTPKQINARPHLESAETAGQLNGGYHSRSVLALTGGVMQYTIPAWVRTCVMVGLIFGGCCSNVFALEAIIKDEPSSGVLITFTQFLLVALHGYYTHFSRHNPPFFLKPNRVPLIRWMTNIVLFFSVNILNNYAFGFDISVPVHIILRSGGSITTMLVGFAWGKRYSRMHVISVALLTVGVIISAIGGSKKSSLTTQSTSLATFLTGLLILFVAQVLSAIMGLYIQATYEAYGSHWRENLFYSHFFSLPLFIPFFPKMLAQFRLLATSPPISFPLTSLAPYLPPAFSTSIQIPYVIAIPKHLLSLLLNALTQFACIRGVNLLGSRASALTVTIVLNIRKLASLLLSVQLFGNKLSPVVMAGAAVVFAAGAMYAWESQRLASQTKARARARLSKTT
ncbi:MAG: golgi uridine diphosphate-N- acetylglucosamine transporter [Geoglossum simile]|nr:MAG: golgi uridine diphosphate-N- acetylglucosamine transporter [Geoglossum simile]